MVQPLIIRGAQVWDGNGVTQRDLYTDGERIAAQPVPDALTVDLEGYTIFPGLINAHDHLELNHYPRSKFRERYNNAHEWGEDMNARLNDEPYKSLRAYPLDDRCFIGGLKNLLCGATTVAHHNPPHKCLFRKDFPVRVLKNYGWAHSLHFNTEEEIVQSYRSTPRDWPWFIHLAEGTDEVAAGEYQRLKALGCVGKNTVIVHGVELSEKDVKDIWRIGDVHPNLVICPSSNLFLLRKTADTSEWIIQRCFAIGSDSRLTADGDLLDEIRSALSIVDSGATILTGWDHRECDVVVATVTFWAWDTLGVKDAGTLDPQRYGKRVHQFRDENGRRRIHVEDDVQVVLPASWADWIVIPASPDPSASLCSCRRADLALVVKSGVPQIGDPEVMAKFPHIQTVAATLDGKPKAIHSDLARRIHQCSLKERGLEVEALPRRRFRLRP